VTTMPLRSVDQRLEALRHANKIRRERAALKRRMRQQDNRQEVCWLLADTIDKPPVWAATMKLRDLLMAAPKWGHVRADRFLARARCSATKTLGGLSDRQRREILGLLEEEATRR
jgi:hypothetical protein